MSIGLAPAKKDIDDTAGEIARGIDYQLRRAQNLKYYLDGQTTAQLVALGYDEANNQEVSRLKSAISTLDQLRQIYEGLIAWSPAADMRTFPRQIEGMGDV